MSIQNHVADPEGTKALLIEHGVTQTRIKTVDRPDGFIVGIVDGELVEVSP